jgi:precorrin-2 dehydrogenase/sirohydrochlorin ferrochelatase
MALFPMFVKLQSRKCVVIGGGRIAAAKIAGLLRAGARIIVVSPTAVAAVRAQAERRQLMWRRREFHSSDVENAFLVIAASNSAATNQSVFRACANQGVLCNVVDDPQRCDFFYPAVVRRGALQIAISTGGCSPALAQRLRRDLQQQFTPKYAHWVRHIAKLRREILSRQLTAAERSRLLREIASREAFESYARSHAKRNQHAAKL